jgi:hypothetical protein
MRPVDAGLLDPHAAHAIDAEAAPTAGQWAQVGKLVFGDAPGPAQG